MLLRRGAKIDAKNDKGITPLHLAVSDGHEEVVDLLLKMVQWLMQRMMKKKHHYT